MSSRSRATPSTAPSWSGTAASPLSDRSSRSRTGPRSSTPPAAGCCRRSEEHTSELQSRFDLVCRPPSLTSLTYTTLFRSSAGRSAERHGMTLTAITHAHVVPIEGDPFDGTVLVRDGRLTALGPELEIPDGAEVVDAAGGWLLP